MTHFRISAHGVARGDVSDSRMKFSYFCCLCQRGAVLFGLPHHWEGLGAALLMGCGGSKPEAEGEAKKDERSTVARVSKYIEENEEDLGSGPLSKADIAARIIGSKEPEHFELGTTGFSLRYACMSQRGYYPEDLYKANQDRYLALPKPTGRSDEIILGVFDGHGNEGDQCSNFVRKMMAIELDKMCKREKRDFPKAYQQTFKIIDDLMHQAEDFDDSYSGTTAITAVFRGLDLHVANIGDSRAIVGERRGNRVIAYTLSVDQTPYRKDERERIKASGGIIKTKMMAQGQKSYKEGWEDLTLGTDLDGTGDPPRVYAPRSNDWPGCAFTRSMGDALGERYGVIPEAELLHKTVTERDQFVVLASDGVWEFITNQSVADIAMRFTDPVDACKQMISEAYQLWLQFDVRVLASLRKRIPPSPPRRPPRAPPAHLQDGTVGYPVHDTYAICVDEDCRCARTISHSSWLTLM